ncbi:hypothetical protein O1611_g8597 [Lasiodiplodia mahajangana]|uniref:Uncharacterized protein n=1 Tax=Lasiodiplodia mahajangana TaxID=1108764 RepID=A0ACC2JC89_9PEZI|nr:hypothetical protein O1611_g8597 [Lasiodiplodia mahajangana]
MKGPFNLGGLSRIIAFIAVAWIVAITTLNYTVVAVGIIAIGATAAWILWARRWFTGPAAEVTEAMRLGVDLTEPRVEENESEKGVKTTGATAESSD